MSKTVKYFKTLTSLALRQKRKSGITWGLPIHLQVETTNDCNLICGSCHRDILYPRTTKMTYDNFKKIFNEIRPLKINVSGLGEPFLNKEIFSMIRYAKSLEIPVNCASNFTVVEDKIESILDSGIDQIKISIDASNRDTFLRIRAKDMYETLVDNITKLNNLKKERGIDKPELRFNYALQRDNIDELLDVIDLANSLNIKAVYIQYLVYIDREERKSRLVGDLTPEIIKNVLLKAEKLTKKYGIRTNIDMWMRDFDLFWNNMRCQKYYVPNNKPCYFPWFTAWIDVDGTVRPCPIIPWQKGIAHMGNVFEQPFAEIWNNKKYRDFRIAHANRERPTEPCRTCIPLSLSTIFNIGTKLLPG